MESGSVLKHSFFDHDDSICPLPKDYADIHGEYDSVIWLSALLKQVGSEGPLLSVARSPRVRTCHLILIEEEGTEALAG